MAKGRRTEIEQLNGLVVEKGREAGIPTPANEGIVAAVRRVERGETPQSPDNIAGL
jgi:2-dehydropantoate 2-reductase